VLRCVVFLWSFVPLICLGSRSTACFGDVVLNADGGTMSLDDYVRQAVDEDGYDMVVME
jgi:hypothetical protein